MEWLFISRQIRHFDFDVVTCKVNFPICTKTWCVNNFVSRQGKGENGRNKSTDLEPLELSLALCSTYEFNQFYSSGNWKDCKTTIWFLFSKKQSLIIHPLSLFRKTGNSLNKENCGEHPSSNLAQNSNAPRSQDVVVIFWARVFGCLVVENARFRMRVNLGVIFFRSLVFTKKIPGRLQSGSGVALI